MPTVEFWRSETGALGKIDALRPQAPAKAAPTRRFLCRVEPSVALLALVPVAPVAALVFHAPAAWVFLSGAIGIAVLADWIRRATEQVAERVGPAIGGLLNVSFGSLAELILAFFVLARGQAAVVQAQVTGSIIGTSLLGLGLAIVVGCIGRESLTFNRERAGQLSTMLIVVLIALLLPAVFDAAGRMGGSGQHAGIEAEELSIGVSIVLVLLYLANLIYTLITHRDVFASEEPRDARDAWPLWGSIAALVAATAAISYEAELVSDALETTARSLGLSTVFLGVIVLAVVGTASDIVAGAFFASRAKMGLALSICIGSAIQMALVVAPLLVIGSWFLGHPMTLVFRNPIDLLRSPRPP